MILKDKVTPDKDINLDYITAGNSNKNMTKRDLGWEIFYCLRDILHKHNAANTNIMHELEIEMHIYLDLLGPEYFDYKHWLKDISGRIIS